jgi:hypothetical protein
MVRHLSDSRPRFHLPRTISDEFGEVVFDDPGSPDLFFICFSFMFVFGAMRRLIR